MRTERFRTVLAGGAAAVVAGSAVAGLTSGWVPLRGAGGSSDAGPGIGVTSSPGEPPAGPAPEPAALTTVVATPIRAAAPPQELGIAALGVRMPVTGVGVRPDGQMEVPTNPGTAGWYRFGPAPADERGAVVVAAHVDSREFGIGPFARLTRLTEGDEVTVSAADTVYRYRVEKVVSVDKEALSTAELFSAEGPPRLHLVTCGGAYAKGSGWDSNIVVVAVRVR